MFIDSSTPDLATTQWLLDQQKKQQDAANGVKTPEKAFEATLAPARQIPQTLTDRQMRMWEDDRGFANAEQARLAESLLGAPKGKFAATTQPVMKPGSYFDIGGGQYANEGDLAALAGAGNAGAFNAMRNRMREDEIRFQNAHFGPRADTQGAVRSADQALMQMLGLGQNAFAADTERGKVGVAEYGAKVNQPAELASREKIAKMQGDTELQKAAIGRQTALEGPIAARAVAIQNDPNMTPEQKKTELALLDQERRMLRAGNPVPGMPGGGGQVQDVTDRFTGPGGAGGPAGPGGVGAAIDAADAAKKTAELQRQLMERALGLTPDGKGGLTGKPSFSPERLAEALSQRNDMTPAQMDEFVKSFREKNLVNPDTAIGQVGRHFVQLARRAGKTEGVGGIGIKTGPEGMVSRDLTLTVPGLGALPLSEGANLGAMARYFGGTQDYLAGGSGRSLLVSPEGQKEAERQAAALGQFFQALIRSGRTGR